MPKKSEKETKISTSEFSLVRKIVALSNVTEEGQIEAFFSKLRKNLTREIAKLEKSADLMHFHFKDKMEDLEEKLNDAKAAEENAYTKLDLSKIKTNAGIDDYASTYWDTTEVAVANLHTVLEAIEDEIELHTEATQSLQDQIDERKRRLDVISAKA